MYILGFDTDQEVEWIAYGFHFVCEVNPHLDWPSATRTISTYYPEELA